MDEATALLARFIVIETIVGAGFVLILGPRFAAKHVRKEAGSVFDTEIAPRLSPVVAAEVEKLLPQVRDALRLELAALAAQAPPEQPAQSSPGFAHGMIDPEDAHEKRREKKQRKLENAIALAEALGEKVVVFKKFLPDEYKRLVDMEDGEAAIALARKVMAKFASDKSTDGIVSYQSNGRVPYQ